MSTFKVGYLIASIAKESINRCSRKRPCALRDELDMREIGFRDLPIYSYDCDADFPQVAKHVKSALAAVGAILFVMPEYKFKPGLITMDGTVTNPSTEEFVRAYMADFHAFVTRVYAVLPWNA